jgi:DNA-directed RNA polymerase subunit RPC12/RpoP
MAKHRQPASVHGPCENCGALYYSATTVLDPQCPNCGHRAGCDE